jgi:hypothetical protein
VSPIDISDSVAKKTVTFDRPITGKELIDAVRSTCAGAGGAKFYETKRYDDGWQHLVGQSSSTPYENLLVTPDRENAYIEPDKTYSEAVVLRHDAPSSGSRTLGRYGVEQEVQSVLDFADSLERSVKHGPEIAAGLSRGLPPRGAATVSSRDVKDPARSDAWGRSRTWDTRRANDLGV